MASGLNLFREVAWQDGTLLTNQQGGGVYAHSGGRFFLKAGGGVRVLPELNPEICQLFLSEHGSFPVWMLLLS